MNPHRFIETGSSPFMAGPPSSGAPIGRQVRSPSPTWTAPSTMPVSVAVGVDLAQGPVDRSVAEQGIGQAVADQGVAPTAGEMLGQHGEGRGAVEVVGVGHPERPRRGWRRRRRGRGPSPAAWPARRRWRRPPPVRGPGGRTPVGDPPASGWRDVALDRLEDLAPNDQHQPAESGRDGVAGRVVDQGRATGPDGGDLLGPAEPGPHAGGQEDQCRIGHGRAAYSPFSRGKRGRS